MKITFRFIMPILKTMNGSLKEVLNTIILYIICVTLHSILLEIYSIFLLICPEVKVVMTFTGVEKKMENGELQSIWKRSTPKVKRFSHLLLLMVFYIFPLMEKAVWVV